MSPDDNTDIRSVRAALSRYVGGPLPAELAGTAEANGLSVGGWVFPSDPAPTASADQPVPDDLVAAGRALRQRAAAAGIDLLLPGDAGWPAGTGCDDLPCLWVAGTADVAGLLRRAITFTGSRAASPYGLHVTTNLAGDLAAAGWTVAAAVGFGVDEAAAQAALAVAGPVLLVAGNAPRLAYPAALTDLVARVAERGAVVSASPAGCMPSRARSAIQHHLLGTLAPATVVVEASARSRALTAAQAATRAGRVVCAVPGPVTSATSTGSHRLLADGARLVTSIADIEAALGAPTAVVDSGPRSFQVTATASWDDGRWRTRTVPPFTVTAASHRQAADTAFEVIFAANPYAPGATLTAGIVDSGGVYEAVQVSSST